MDSFDPGTDGRTDNNRRQRGGGEVPQAGQRLTHAPFKYAARKKSERQGLLYRFHRSRLLSETCLAQLACVGFCYVASTFRLELLPEVCTFV